MAKHKILKSYIVKDFKKITTVLYGKTKAKELSEKHKALCLCLAEENKGLSKKEEFHYFVQILPFIAVYKIMQEEDLSRAHEILRTIMENVSYKSAKMLKALLKIPFLYRKVPKICNSLVLKQFCQEAGFEYGDISYSKTEWKADITKCPYVETCERYNCIEIASYFCDSDDIIYGSIHKKVNWKRTKTLGRGNDICDFNVEIKKG